MDRTLLTVGVSALAMLASAGAASAQTSGSSGGAYALDEVVVTARRVEERLQDVPLAIVAIKGEELTNRGVVQLSDLAKVAPGLMIAPHAARSFSNVVTLRGQRYSDAPTTQSPTVVTYVDNVVVMSMHGANMGLFDLESVQVLKGPQGTLFGRNTTGGAVLITTANPAAEYGGEVKIGYGNFDQRTAEGFVNLPVSDSFRMRLSAMYFNNDGYGRIVEGVGVGTKVGNRREFSTRLKAVWEPSDAVKSTTSLYYSEGKAGDPGAVPPSSINPGSFIPLLFPTANAQINAQLNRSNPYDKGSNVVPYQKVLAKGVNNETSFQVSDNLTLKNIFGYRFVRFSDQFDFDATTVPILASQQKVHTKLFTDEVQLIGTAMDGRLSYVAGAYYYHEKDLELNAVRTFSNTPTSYGGDVLNESLSGFAQADYKLTDTITATAGFRYTHDKRSFRDGSVTGGYLPEYGEFPVGTGCSFIVNGVALPANACTLKVKASWSKPTWLLGLKNQFGDDTMAYVVTRRGYRAGGFNLRGNSVETLGPFNPETVTDVEAGFKSINRFGDDWSLSTTAAAYYQWYKDMQKTITALTSTGAPGGFIKNVASADLWGGELELQLRKAREFQFTVGYSYVHPKYNDFPLLTTINGVANQPANYKDRQFSGVPRHQLSFAAAVWTDTDYGRLGLYGDISYRSKAFFSEDVQSMATLKQTVSPAVFALTPRDIVFGNPSQTFVNLRAELENVGGSPLTVAIWGRNIFDRVHTNGGVFLYHNLGMSLTGLAPPRTYGVEVKAKF